MARLFSSGFELQSVTNGVEWDTFTGTPAIATAIKRSGGASMRINTAGTARYATHRFRGDSTARTFVRFYIYIASAPAAATYILRHGDGSGFGYKLRLNTNRTLAAYTEGDVAIGSASSALALDTWYRVEVDYNDASSDVISCYLDGVAFVSGGTASDNGGGGVIDLGIITATTADVYFEDVAVNDAAAGGTQTGLPGAGSIVHMHPTAAGDNALVTGTFADIDEVIPDDATTIAIVATATTEIGEYNCETALNAGIDSYDTVTLVSVGIRFAMATAASANFALRIKSAASGTTTIGGTVTGAVTAYNTHDDTAGAKQYKLTSYTDPTTGIAWTPTGTNSLDNMQIGVYSPTDATPDINVSTLWALVEYVDGVAPGGTVVKDIIGVGIIPFAR
jgi:hypothetical protein